MFLYSNHRTFHKGGYFSGSSVWPVWVPWGKCLLFLKSTISVERLSGQEVAPSLQEGSCSLLTPFPWASATLILTAAWDRQSLTGAFSEVRKCLLTGFEVPSCLWKVKPQVLKSLSAPAQFGDKATSRHRFQWPQTRDRLGSAPSQ